MKKVLIVLISIVLMACIALFIVSAPTIQKSSDYKYFIKRIYEIDKVFAMDAIEGHSLNKKQIDLLQKVILNGYNNSKYRFVQPPESLTPYAFKVTTKRNEKLLIGYFPEQKVLYFHTGWFIKLDIEEEARGEELYNSKIEHMLISIENDVEILLQELGFTIDD